MENEWLPSVDFLTLSSLFWPLVFIVFSAQFYFSTDYEVGVSKFMHNFVIIGIVKGLTNRPEDTLNIQFEWKIIVMAHALIPGMELWNTNELPFISYTTFPPHMHSSTKRDFPTYVTSHIQYAYI